MMKKILIGIILLGLLFASIYFYCDKSSKNSCVRNLDKYKAALNVILENKDQIARVNKKPDDPNWEAQIISRKSIENLEKDNLAYISILYLWENGLISDDYGISFLKGDWNSIDFDLPGEDAFLTFIAEDKFNHTCASGQIMKHYRLEKYWYYVYYCPL